MGTLDSPFYYLENFQQVLDWIGARYADLLTPAELDFLNRFPQLPQASRALLVRMVMRKGEYFRSSKLCYAEIGNTIDASLPLATEGWISTDPAIDIDTLFALLDKPEIVHTFGLTGAARQWRKADQLLHLRDQFTDVRPYSHWVSNSGELLIALRIQALCDRLRLIYFGNSYQDWSEFVLSDLGVYQYEHVAFTPESRGFRQRQDIDDFLALQHLRDRLATDEDPSAILQIVPAPDALNPWLRSRRDKLIFQLGQQLEKLRQWPQAYSAYRQTTYPGARVRAIRVLEKDDDVGAAHLLLEAAWHQPESETELQHLRRIAPRLQRRLGRPISKTKAAPPATLHLVLPLAESSVEEAVRLHMHTPEAPAYYVENTLINSLFGLLFWDAIFSAIPGAFFHPFHRGPADLSSADFRSRRAERFDALFAQLEDGRYRATIDANFQLKQGIQSPFVFWEWLTPELLDLALRCIPAAHLRKWFDRLLADIKTNRSGLPDLIQFWPDEQRYHMIEVKGPGDRLQDNQLRWMGFCAEHGMPVSVCYLQWQAPI